MLKIKFAWEKLEKDEFGVVADYQQKSVYALYDIILTAENEERAETVCGNIVSELESRIAEIVVSDYNNYYKKPQFVGCPTEAWNDDKKEYFYGDYVVFERMEGEVVESKKDFMKAMQKAKKEILARYKSGEFEA